jgi:hypothetical protein
MDLIVVQKEVDEFGLFKEVTEDVGHLLVDVGVKSI